MMPGPAVARLHYSWSVPSGEIARRLRVGIACVYLWTVAVGGESGFISEVLGLRVEVLDLPKVCRSLARRVIYALYHQPYK